MIRLKQILIEQTLGQNWYNLSKDPTFVNYIKKVEGLKLTAYDLNDGMITIGYGHAEKKKTSKYKVGDTITKQDAELILRLDIEEHEMRVDRWMINEGYKDVKLSKLQKSMLTDYAFNPGLTMFPNFSKAVVFKDWDRAKKEYIRKDGSLPLGRNKIFKQTFLDKIKPMLTSKDFTFNKSKYQLTDEVTININKEKLPVTKISISVTLNGNSLTPPKKHTWLNVIKGVLQFNINTLKPNKKYQLEIITPAGNIIYLHLDTYDKKTTTQTRPIGEKLKSLRNL